MPGCGRKSFPCVLCNKRTKPKERRSLTGEQNNQYRNYLQQTFFINVKPDDVTCHKCHLKFYRVVKPVNIRENNSEIDPDFIPVPKKSKLSYKSPKNITLPIISTGNSHSSCCVCKRRDTKLTVITAEARYRLFIEKGHLLKCGSRCCVNHLCDKYFTRECIENIEDHTKHNEQSQFNRTDIINLISSIREIAIRHEKTRIDFDNVNALTESDYVNLTGLSKTDFEYLCEHVTTIRSTKNRTSRTCLALLLVKLRSGMSNTLLSTLFNIGKSGIRRAISSTRTALGSHFTPKFVGFRHISREVVIKDHTRPLAQELFGSFVQSPAILVLDGTYIYIQKSNHFKFQRRSYSLHKGRPLVKPMMFVSTTGYIVSVMGSYLADSKNNDANILKHAIATNSEDINEWISEEDVLVVDRGFRDSLGMLEDLGIKAEMPTFLPKGQKQHSTEEANASRLVTKVRWIVESVNGRIKQWKYLSNIVPNSQIPFIGDYVRLVAALCNKYKRPLNSGDEEEDQILAAKMRVLAKEKNQLKDRVANENLARRSGSWKKMDADHVATNFPSLSEEDLRNITLGVYQLKLARSYTQEHLDDNGDYIIMIDDSVSNIVRVQIQSRHTSAKRYLSWIEYDEVVVKSWYCQCRAGARVVGACAHVSSILWYLGFARHANQVHGIRNWALCLEDASQMPVLVDASDTDSDPEE
ncbi:uncharacterized protein LOC117315068 [Pecten maximus]|uniref:uncharacterized protein LOC117315068 n=1 Tax=Pecten maximus TaxID=6579 RepID=UPI00145842D0|nr:uncharacterized protein LOC117315068 [Pecten maximus]